MSLMVKRRSQTKLGMTNCANRKLEGLEARISQWVRGAVHQIRQVRVYHVWETEAQDLHGGRVGVMPNTSRVVDYILAQDIVRQQAICTANT